MTDLSVVLLDTFFCSCETGSFFFRPRFLTVSASTQESCNPRFQHRLHGLVSEQQACAFLQCIQACFTYNDFITKSSNIKTYLFSFFSSFNIINCKVKSRHWLWRIWDVVAFRVFHIDWRLENLGYCWLDETSLFICICGY